MANQNLTPWELHDKFIPKNKYGDPLPRSQRWGDIVYEQNVAAQEAKEAEKVAQMEAWLASSNFGPKNAEIKAQIRKLYELDQAARNARAIRNRPEPAIGDFITDNSGKHKRFVREYWEKIDPSAANYNAARAAAAPDRVNNPSMGNYKKVKGKVFRWTEWPPKYVQVDRSTNYNIDLADTFDRYAKLGKPYLDARDHLWSIFYPEEAPIYRPAAYRRRNTRRANRKTRRANRRNTRKY